MEPKRAHETKAKHRKVLFIEGNGIPLRARVVSRNSLCPCKSGKKAKHCCGVETRYYTIKPKKVKIGNTELTT